MKLTLLQYVQSIASSLNSDEVNSISDNAESLQIAEIVRQVYFNIITRTHLPENKQFLQFEPSLNVATPTLMYLPDGSTKIDWIKYFNNNVTSVPPGTTPHGTNVDITPTPSWSTTSTTTVTVQTGPATFTVASSTLGATVSQGVTCTASTGQIMNGYVVSYSGTTLVLQITNVAGGGSGTSWTIVANPAFNLGVPGYQDVFIIPVDEFINVVTSFNPTDTNVITYTFSDTSNNFPGNFTFYARNDRQPFYCTVVSDYYVLFDSYDSTVDSTLQASKCLAYGQVIPAWENVDTFIPLIDEAQVPLLLNEAKSLAFYELKQSLHQKAEQESKRQWSSVQRDKSRVDKPSYFDQLPNFGRWGRSSYAGLSFFKQRGWDRP